MSSEILYNLTKKIIYGQPFEIKNLSTAHPSSSLPATRVNTLKGWNPPTVGGRIERSFTPGGSYMGSASFTAHYKFIDQESGTVIYETDLQTSSTGTNDTVGYAMDRNGEALAKVITKSKGK